jgi:hypothetical protein
MKQENRETVKCLKGSRMNTGLNTSQMIGHVTNMKRSMIFVKSPKSMTIKIMQVPYVN